ncbi:MAG TPA: metallophosphoesterase family protein [Dehalococcoidia bacterium]|nr:metallophosphoesterase family protein [Dehalococcoidia bacterium]
MTGKPLSPEERRIYVEALEQDGFHVTKSQPKERAAAKIDFTVKPGDTIRIGCVSDTHIGSKHQQMTALRDFYRYADERGAQTYLHGGDLLEGLHVHRDAVYEQYAHGVDAQVAAAVDQYPKSANGKTLFIDGNHDAWSFENAGVTSGALLAMQRPDLQYLGYYSAFVELGKLRILLQHGAKGGGPYGKSYRPQRLLEQLAVEERSQTHMALYGHWHTDLYLGRYQGVFGFSLPCFKKQDRFLRSLGKSPTIGAFLLEIEFTRDMKVWNLRHDWKYYEPREGDYPR